MPKITQVHKQVSIRSGSDYSLALLACDFMQVKSDNLRRITVQASCKLKWHRLKLASKHTYAWKITILELVLGV